jgi:hypothetical protein
LKHRKIEAASEKLRHVFRTMSISSCVLEDFNEASIQLTLPRRVKLSLCVYPAYWIDLYADSHSTVGDGAKHCGSSTSEGIEDEITFG